MRCAATRVGNNYGWVPRRRLEAKQARIAMCFLVEAIVLPCSERERHAAAVVVGCVYQPETGLGRF